MTPPAAQAHTITIDDTQRVSALLLLPPAARACFVMAHGAGAGMAHPSMEALATGLYALNIATLRYQFPYMERGSRRPDPPQLCHATVRAAVSLAARLVPALPLIAGGRSFGGRMTSQAQAKSPLPGVLGLAFLAFPLHPADRPSSDRAEHLFEVRIPLLFLQGTRDALADLQLVEKLVSQLGERATLKLLQDADHSYHVPARTGRKDPEVRSELLQALADWTESLLHPPPRRRSRS
jgi:predicted alpha/beta-hydrolase family hydrolase